MSKRSQIAEYWDKHVQLWLDGEDPRGEPLPKWFSSYSGTGRGQVSRDGFVEPFLGDLMGKPQLVVLGLNPGEYFANFQSRTGLFADEIRAAGGYTAWSATCPYSRDPWVSQRGRNRYYSDRITFTGRWTGSPNPQPRDLLVFELYPWHSTGVVGAMRPPPEIIDQFVWQPISELDVPQVFAFGREWDTLAGRLALPLIATLGAGGVDYGSTVASRAVRIYRLLSGQHLIVEWHSGSAGPPSLSETQLLRSAVEATTSEHT